MDKIIGIYKITSPTGKIYIGQSVNIVNRKSRYKNLQCEQQYKIYRSLKKYGWEAHNFEIIHVCERHELNNLEIFYIKKYDTFNTEHGLNLKSGGNVEKCSDETKRKMSLKLLGNTRTLNYKYSEERRLEINAKILKAKEGYSHSEETRQKISRSHFGIKGSKESIEKAKETRKNREYENRAGSYEIYNENNKLIHKFQGDFRRTLENLNIPYKAFSKSYRFNRKISKGNYKNWFAVKL